ncbi:hypothetical protein ES703_124931 [subsurface metagenome]
MELPAFHGQGHDEAAQEQKDDVVEVETGHLPAGHDLQDGESHHRQDGRDRQGHRLGEPPDDHPEGYSGGIGDCGLFGVKVHQQDHQQGGQGPGPLGDAAEGDGGHIVLDLNLQENH